MRLHTFFFSAPEALARPPVGLEFKDLPHEDAFDEEAAGARKAACQAGLDSVYGECDERHREQLSLGGDVGCVFERCMTAGVAACPPASPPARLPAGALSCCSHSPAAACLGGSAMLCANQSCARQCSFGCHDCLPMRSCRLFYHIA